MKPFFNTVFIACLALLVNCSNEAETVDQSVEDRSIAPDNIATTQNVEIYGIDKLKYVVPDKNEALQTSGTVTVNGEIYYLLEGINTKAGEELTVTLTTISNFEAAAMSHNWLLLKQKADPLAFATASLQAKANDYVSPEKMNLVITETGLIAPSESVTITFTTPQQAGDYEYICTFPGHFAAGMRGTLHVK